MQYYRWKPHPQFISAVSFSVENQWLMLPIYDQLKLNYRDNTLTVHLKNGESIVLDTENATHIFFQMLTALTHLNKYKMKHGDVKMANCVVDWRGRPCSGLLKLIDYECTTKIDNQSDPPTFFPPKDTQINPDLWAFFHELSVFYFKCRLQDPSWTEEQLKSYFETRKNLLEKVETESLDPIKKELLRLIKEILVDFKALTFDDANSLFSTIMSLIKQPLCEESSIKEINKNMYKKTIATLIRKKDDLKKREFSLDEMYKKVTQVKNYLTRYKKHLKDYLCFQEFNSLRQLCMTEIDNQIKCFDDILACCRRFKEQETGKECCTANVEHLQDIIDKMTMYTEQIIEIPEEETLFDVTELHISKHPFFQTLNLKKQEIKLGVFSKFFSQLEKEDFGKAYQALKKITGSEEKKELRLKLLGIMKKKLESNIKKLEDYLSKTKRQKRSDFSQKTVQNITVSLKEIQIKAIKLVIDLIDRNEMPTNNIDGKEPDTLEEALEKMQLDVPIVKDLLPPPTFRKGSDKQLPFDITAFPEYDS